MPVRSLPETTPGANKATVQQMVWDWLPQINPCDKKVTNVTHSGMISGVMKSKIRVICVKSLIFFQEVSMS